MKGYFLPTLKMSGPEQMAADIMLLEKVIAHSDISFILRFYNWQGFWLSIGKNQDHIANYWEELIKDKKIQIVRRPSGGNAVLHGGGLTYALVWLSPPRKRHEAYYLASQWLVKGFLDLGIPLRFGNQSPNQFEKNCFATSTAADLIDPDGNKRIGSAQFWRSGHLLQHGEILLDPPNQLWMELFHTKAPKPVPNHIPRQGLDELLYKACRNYWPEVHWNRSELNKNDLNQIAITAEKYSLSIN